MYATDARQDHCLMPPPRGQGHNVIMTSYFGYKKVSLSNKVSLTDEQMWLAVAATAVNAG